jgi:hypothetical protein
MKSLKFKDFSFKIIIERLGINKEIDEYSDKIYKIIKNSDKDKFIFTDLPKNTNISKLTLSIKKSNTKLGELCLNKSKNTKDGWVIYINLSKDFYLDTLKHELNHALRLTLIGKDKVISNLNYIRSKGGFFNVNNSEIEEFFYIIYLANDEEINSTIIETHGYIKEIMKKWNVDKLSKKDFEYIIKNSPGYSKSNLLINFTCEDNFKSFNKNQLNKFFYILEENKDKLEKIEKSYFRKIKLAIKVINDLFINKINFDEDFSYKPKRGSDFYNNWINKQGERLKKRLYRLYDHYQN